MAMYSCGGEQILPPLCECKDRFAAMDRSELLYAYELGGWIFASVPLRHRFGSAIYYAVERGVEDHTGEPFVFTTCPFCGLELPTPAPRDDATGFDDNTNWR